MNCVSQFSGGKNHKAVNYTVLMKIYMQWEDHSYRTSKVVESPNHD